MPDEFLESDVLILVGNLPVVVFDKLYSRSSSTTETSDSSVIRSEILCPNDNWRAPVHFSDADRESAHQRRILIDGLSKHPLPVPFTSFPGTPAGASAICGGSEVRSRLSRYQYSGLLRANRAALLALPRVFEFVRPILLRPLC